mmetsp:Transcript_5059/g.10715  ORF Transcript_5059/g.10715 Transcript_5059/m.10715 type:complete len:84 (-) Transcript_5059:192-443(-)
MPGVHFCAISRGELRKESRVSTLCYMGAKDRTKGETRKLDESDLESVRGCSQREVRLTLRFEEVARAPAAHRAAVAWTLAGAR